MALKYGRLPRGYDPRIPHFSATVAGKRLTPIPAEVDYLAGMPANLGYMLNNNIGDCTCAACGHFDQIWSFNASGKTITPPDADVLALYEQAGGYLLGQPSTDQGASMQVVLYDWFTSGFAGNKLAGYIEVDPRNFHDLQQVIWQGGGLYMGFSVPAYLQYLESPGATWDLPGTNGIDSGADTSIIGGHAVVGAGYDASGNIIIESWGSRYTMTSAFRAKYVDECYGLGNQLWIEKTGLSPAGLTLEQWAALMQGLGGPAPVDREHRHWRRNRRWHGNA